MSKICIKITMRYLLTYPGPNIYQIINNIYFLLYSLNPGTAAGPDNISPRILKELHNEIAPIITDIFNTSLSEGIVPDDWKIAYVTPVYKNVLNANGKTTAQSH